MPTHVGSDEAGKGPVLGPMVAAAVRVDPDDLPAAVDDSKRLTPERRAELAAEIRAATDAVGVGVVSTARIDAPETDMNGLTVAAHVEAVAAVARDGDPVYADAGDVSESRFARRVAGGADERGVSVDVRAEHGADGTYPIVAAASIVAKVERDRRVEELRAEYGDVGSGYPSDPTTRTFLREYVREHGRLPACARASWKTCDDVLRAAEQSALDDF
ncbi:ribonuclease HII [Salinigranum rubrum]|uniref:Ribonuclease HII n=1 Tax=Salinigranum rubrum TaxID=755307 RepID=A0A2I8VEG8_9EURY|nr:ribonuclease HII [Salinigranum rubrum]AUV80322.1 ribonuclease HII [Salinigranum rubrum]